MVLGFFRRKGGREPGVRAGREKGVFLVEQVFEIGSRPLSFLVLAGRLLRGEMRVGDLLRLPDGRLLRVDAIESRRERLERAEPNTPLGVKVSGVGWRPQKSDFREYLARRLVERLMKEAVERLAQRMPREAAEKLAEEEVRRELESRLESIGLTVHEAAPAEG